MRIGVAGITPQLFSPVASAKVSPTMICVFKVFRISPSPLPIARQNHSPCLVHPVAWNTKYEFLEPQCNLLASDTNRFSHFYYFVVTELKCREIWDDGRSSKKYWVFSLMNSEILSSRVKGILRRLPEQKDAKHQRRRVAHVARGGKQRVSRRESTATATL